MISGARSRPRAKFHMHGLQPGCYVLFLGDTNFQTTLFPCSLCPTLPPPSLAILSHNSRRGCGQLPGSCGLHPASPHSVLPLLPSDFVHTESRAAWPPSVRTLLAGPPCPFRDVLSECLGSPWGRTTPPFLIHTTTPCLTCHLLCSAAQSHGTVVLVWRDSGLGDGGNVRGKHII